jgi:NAD dependent epimerase/dehydratase family enzyme
VLHRPTPFVVPSFAARMALGEFATEVLIGQRALPRKLTASGFAFRDTDLEACLRRELER